MLPNRHGRGKQVRTAPAGPCEIFNTSRHMTMYFVT